MQLRLWSPPGVHFRLSLKLPSITHSVLNWSLQWCSVGVSLPWWGSQHRSSWEDWTWLCRVGWRWCEGHRHNDGDFYKVFRSIWRLHCWRQVSLLTCPVNHLQDFRKVESLSFLLRCRCCHCQALHKLVDEPDWLPHRFSVTAMTVVFGNCTGEIRLRLFCRKLIDALRSHSPAQLAAGSISAPSVAQIVSAFKVIMGKDGSNRGIEKIQQLRDNANYMRDKLISMGCHVLGDYDSPVLVSHLTFKASLQWYYPLIFLSSLRLLSSWANLALQFIECKQATCNNVETIW